MDILEFTKQKLDAQALNIDEETGMIHGYTVPNYHSNLKPGVYHTFTNNVNFALSVFANLCISYIFKITGNVFLSV